MRIPLINETLIVVVFNFGTHLEQAKWWGRIKDVTTAEEVEKAYQDAMHSMARLNRNAARLMHKFDAHGATDVTGFGILGHARNLAANQKSEVSLVVHTLPILANMVKIFKACGIDFKLLEGFSAETSGLLSNWLTKTIFYQIPGTLIQQIDAN